MKPYLALFSVALCLLACVRDMGHDRRFVVSCCVNQRAIECDSAALYALDDDYGQLRALGHATSNDGRFEFSGHVDRPEIGLIKFARRDGSSYSFYFVLEAGHIFINLDVGHWLINGGRLNRKYQLKLNHHARLQARRDSLWQRYVTMGTKDSTLTWDDERSFLRADSALCDSMQHIVVECAGRDDPASRLIKQRLMPTLTRRTLDLLREREYRTTAKQYDDEQ